MKFKKNIPTFRLLMIRFGSLKSCSSSSALITWQGRPHKKQSLPEKEEEQEAETHRGEQSSKAGGGGGRNKPVPDTGAGREWFVKDRWFWWAASWNRPAAASRGRPHSLHPSRSRITRWVSCAHLLPWVSLPSDTAVSRCLWFLWASRERSLLVLPSVSA